MLSARTVANIFQYLKFMWLKFLTQQIFSLSNKISTEQKLAKKKVWGTQLSPLSYLREKNQVVK